MGFRRAITLVGVIVVLLAAAPAALAATAPALATPPAAPKCETVNDARWCVAPSTLYPRAVGWYGWVGHGSPCGPTPLPGYFGGQIGPCVMPAPETVWRPTSYGWARGTIAVGTTTYVYPYTDTWRWIWTPTSGWAAIPASRLLLKWRG